MAINLNPEVWGSNEHLILSKYTDQNHGAFYYPYFKATEEEYQADPDNIITITKAIKNGNEGLSQSTTNSVLDYSICSWSINGNAAINKPYYLGYYTNKEFDAFTIGVERMFAEEDTAYPAFFFGGGKQQVSGGYTLLNNSKNLTDNAKYNKDFQSPEFITPVQNDRFSCNTPIASFGYKSPILFLSVCCCTENCFNTFNKYGSTKNSVPATIDDENFYTVSVYDYFNTTIDGEPLNKLYPIIMYVRYAEAYDALNSAENESDNPNRSFDINNSDWRRGAHPVSVIKMISLKDYQEDTIFGVNGEPWYNWNNIYNDGSKFRVILGMIMPQGNSSFIMDNYKVATKPVETIAYVTKKSRNYERSCQVFLRSHDKSLLSKEVTRIYHYLDNTGNDPCLLIGYKNLTQDEILREASYLGLWFTTLPTLTSNMDLNLYTVCSGGDVESTYDLNEYYMPIFDEHMVTTGEYISATEINKNSLDLIKQYPNIGWGWRFNLTPEYKYDYNYRPPKPDPGGDDDTKNKPKPDRGYLNTKYNRNNSAWGSSIYVMSGQTLQDVKNFINSGVVPPESTDLSTWLDVDWYGQDPGDFILGVNRFPIPIPISSFDLPNINVVIGKTKAYKGNILDQQYITATQKRTTTVSINFGTLTIPVENGNFLDYEPYATYQIFIPYVGTYTLEGKVWVGHNCTIILNYDLINCDAMCEIWRDNLWYDTIYGTFGSPIPFLSYNSGSHQNAIFNAQNNLNNAKMSMLQSSLSTISSITGTVIGAKSGDIQGAISSGVGAVSGIADIFNSVDNFELAKYNLEHTAARPSTTSGVGGISTKLANNNCILVMTYSQPLSYSNSQYGKTVGYACCETGRLREYGGYTVCNNVRFNNFSGTQNELNEIKQILNSGVVLP